MKKHKNRSEVSLPSDKSDAQFKEDIYVPPLDALSIKILNLRVPDEDPQLYSMKITFFDQLLVYDVITSTNCRRRKERKAILSGVMNYDPSDYEKMCLFADNPLTVKIHTFKNLENLSNETSASPQSQSHKSSSQSRRIELDGYCCNIDILPIFIGKDKMILKRRLEPITPPSVLLAKSWDNLPEVVLSVDSIKNQENKLHHNKFKDINFMKISLVGCYNMMAQYEDNYVYTAATKLPMENEMHTGIFTFSRGYRVPKRFKSFSFYPHWESRRLSDEPFTKGYSKLQMDSTELQNEENIDFNTYVDKDSHTAIWASYHRSLMLKDTEIWLSKHLRAFNWPLELTISVDNNIYSFMGFLDLFKLLYPGEKTARLVVPLQWLNRESMMAKCGCEPLSSNTEKVSSTIVQKSSKATSDSANIDATLSMRATGGDGCCAFVIVQVSLAKPFREPVIPPHISKSDIQKLLLDMEAKTPKRECTGRGQLDANWCATVRHAANSLRHVPYFGSTDLCTVNRQLGGSKTRVELLTSFWQEAAIYVNNNFVVNDFLHSDVTFEEMIAISHACLMQITNDVLTGSDNVREKSTLKAARHARQLQDLPHAAMLYMQHIVDGPRDANSWRELSTCLKDVDMEWSDVCLNKSIILDPRQPLSLLSKSCMILDEDPEAAEPFFLALIAFHPFWIPLHVCVSAYFLQREMFHMSHEIMVQIKKLQMEGVSEEPRYPRAWERELGDWWDNTPLLPGTNLYYDAADLLLRIRAISLAEVCVARALSETGECPVYYHLVALCCRLKGRIEDALCHLKEGIDKFGEISYLRSLEGECRHKQKEFGTSMASFAKTGNSGGPYTVLLSLNYRDPQRTRLLLTDLVRRHPSAYAWMALADFWITCSAMGEGGDAEATAEQRIAKLNATSCCLKALKCDRRVARAWTMLAALVQPRERKQYCKEMAAMCDYNKHVKESSKASLKQVTPCYNIGKALRECRCKMCDILTF